MKYFLSFDNPLTHFFTVRLEIDTKGRDQVKLHFPLWRPGRYEATYYAKNTRGFKISGKGGQDVDHVKLDPSIWSVDTASTDQIVVTYDYFAFRMDGGNSWFDEDQIYVNFINCLVYDPMLIRQPCTLDHNIPDHYQIACGLSQQGKTFIAKDYYQLVDSPVMSAPELEHYTYEVDHTLYHIWLNGDHAISVDKLVGDFKRFTASQISVMGELPERAYHFLIQVLPYKFYHGVEHYNSTVICIGPGEDLNTPGLYTQLLGVSSHELFHAWNVVRIRPAELMPYNFNKEVFFPTGFVAEGFTTYYGDLFLVRSGVFDQEAFFHELNTLFKRHFLNFGRLNLSVVNSSLDLWMDGYAANAPERKSSIYVEGAMVALCLDLMIRKKTKDLKSLDDVTRILWARHGKPEIGYTYEDVQGICEEVYDGNLNAFFEQHVKGTTPKYSILNDLLRHVGCQLVRKDAENDLEKYFGIRLLPSNNNLKVIQIAPDSIGALHFSLNDELLAVNGQKPDGQSFSASEAQHYDFLVKRNGKEVAFQLPIKSETYFHQYLIEPLEQPSEEARKAFKLWTGHPLIKD